MATKGAIWRWLRVVGVALAAVLAIVVALLLPALVGLLPEVIRRFPVGWSAVALAGVFGAAHVLVQIWHGDDEPRGRLQRVLEWLDAGSGRALDGGLQLSLVVIAFALLLT